jgi:uncharacterized damage-inducible protein DinB
MTEVDEQGRREPAPQGDEVETLLAFLDYHRDTLAWKCSGLGAAELNSPVGRSTMTLGGLLKHLAYVEDIWLSRRMFGNDPAPPWNTVDWSLDRDWDWHSASADSPDELLSLWQSAVDHSRALVDQALELGGLDKVAQRTDSQGRLPNLRWIVVHLIEEYARHNGHADLIRESIDGSTGE